MPVLLEVSSPLPMAPITPILAELTAQVVRALKRGEAYLDAAEAETLQLLALDLETLGRSGAPDAHVIRDLVAMLARLDGARHPWAVRFLEAIHRGRPAADLDAAIAHDIEVGRRVLAAHRFLEGRDGPADFRDLAIGGDGELRLGLGLQLSDGSLQRFLTVLARHSGRSSPLLALQPFFDSEAVPLAAAIDRGPDAVADFLRAQLVWRHEPLRGRLVGTLPDVWQTRFGRLAANLEARQLQLEITAGARLTAARQTAGALGVRSLRGLAFTFDVEPLVRRIATTYGTPGSTLVGLSEADRMVGLADRILARLGGQLSRYWETRLRTVIDGQGVVDGHEYQEERLLGPNADRLPWRYDPTTALDESGNAAEPVSVPVQGRDYIVQADDHLSRIARLAYAGKADYRYLLAHNPHITAPGDLAPGQRLYIPRWPPPRSDRAIRLVRRTPLESGVEGNVVRVAGRAIGPLLNRSAEALAALATRLGELDASALVRARAARLAEGWAVLIDGRLLVQLDDRDLQPAMEHFAAQSDPLGQWAAHVAAQVRGDLVLGPGHAIPFGHVAAEPHRNRWVRAALQRAAQLGQLDRVTLRVTVGGLRVEVRDATGGQLVTLETEDLAAIRQQPGRRLSDLKLAADALAAALATLWVCDLRRVRAEAFVPPVAGLRNFRMERDGAEALLLVPMGSPVFPAARGVVRHCGPTGSAGNGILVDHGDGWITRYTHLATLAVRPGQWVEADRILGRSGMTGAVDEPCLGFAVERRPLEQPADVWRTPFDVTEPVADVMGKVVPALPDITVVFEAPDGSSEGLATA